MLAVMQKIIPAAVIPTILVIVVLAVIASSCATDDTEPGCNFDEVSYSGTVAPIMAAHCNRCHTGSSAEAGIITATHAGLSDAARNGRLMGAINHVAGFSPMPKGSSKLQLRQRNQVGAWVNHGTQNN